MKTKSKPKTQDASPALIRFDWAMKRLLRQKANYTVLEGFLSVLLHEDVKIINMKESESDQTHVKDKFNRVDIFVENSVGELLIIEIQNSTQVDYFLRMVYGVSKAIVEHISLGESYSNIRKVYHINIVYFKLGHGKDYVYYGATEFRGLHCHDVLQLTNEQKKFFADKRKNVSEVKDLFAEYFILCVEDFDDVAKDSLDEWIYYFKNNRIPEDFTAPGLKEARKRLQYYNLSEEQKRDYERHIDQMLYEDSTLETALLKGEIQGFAKGEEERSRLQTEKEAAISEKEAAQAEKEAAILEKEAAQAELKQKDIDLVIKNYKEGVPIESISKFIGLTIEEVKSILSTNL